MTVSKEVELTRIKEQIATANSLRQLFTQSTYSRSEILKLLDEYVLNRKVKAFDDGLLN